MQARASGQNPDEIRVIKPREALHGSIGVACDRAGRDGMEDRMIAKIGRPTVYELNRQKISIQWAQRIIEIKLLARFTMGHRN